MPIGVNEFRTFYFPTIGKNITEDTQIYGLRVLK
jgi:hypothetical protein